MAREITGDEEEGPQEGSRRSAPRKSWPWTLLGFFNSVVYVLAAAAIVLVYLPGADPAEPAAGKRDVLGLIRDADAEAKEQVEISEETFNALLEGTLEALETGPVSTFVRHGRGWVYLHEGRAEIFLEQRVFGYASTISLEIELDEVGIQRTLTVTGGRFGRLPVPVGGLRLVLPAFASLKDAYKAEVAAILAAKKITFEPGKMVLSL